MAVKDFKFNLDIEKEDYIPKFKVKQHDTAIFYINLLENGTPFPVTNENIKIFARKSDGKLIYQENEISIENGLIKINVKNQAFTSAGLAYAELELKSNAGQATTATFIYEVREKVGSDKAVESVTDISTLEKIDKYVEEAKKELDKFKNTLAPLEDLVANKDKLEGQNTEAKVNIKELEKVLDQANTIVSDEGKKVVGNNVVSNGVTNGYIQDIKLTGKSLVNEILSRANFNGSDKTVYTTIKLQKGKLYANKTYTYIPLGVPSKCNSMYLGTSDSTMVAIRNAPVKPTTFILPRDALENELLPHFYGADFTLDDFINTKLMILEGDYTQNPSPYFEGIKSIGDGVDNIEINSCNLNAFNEDLLSSRLESDGYYHFRTSGNTRCNAFMGFVDAKAQQITSMTPNLVTYISDINLEGCRFLIGLNGDKADDKVLIPIGDIGYLNTRFFKGCESIIVDNNHIKFRNIELSYGKTSSSYIPHEQSKRKLLYYDSATKSWEKPILREWDTIEQHSNGKYYYHKRSVLEVWTGNEGWILNNHISTHTCWYIHIPKVKKFSELICDKLPMGIAGRSDYSSVGSSNYTSLYITLPKDTTPVEYLKTNNITVVYQLAQEEVYECLDISVRAFRDETMLSVSSGPIDPGVEYYIPTGFVSADSSLSSKLENTDSELINLLFDYLGHNHDSRYFTQSQSDEKYLLKYAGDVTDFNTCLTEGIHSVGSSSDLPNAPYVDPGMGIYGTLEVLKKKNEYIQRFTSNICKMFVRFRNYAGVWSPWNRAISDKDYSKGDTYGENQTHYTIYPNGTCIQWGQVNLSFTGSNTNAKGYAYYPVPFKQGDANICTGNVATNTWTGFSDITCSVVEDNQSRAFIEVRRIDGQSPGEDNKKVRVNWIAIGRV